MKFIDADGLADNTEPALLVLLLDRNEIERGNLASALERLHVLTDSLENIRRYKDWLIFRVHGYDDDPRELFEIPEVRDYFKKLLQEWPHFLWFIHRGVGAIALLFTLLCEIKRSREPDGRYVTTFVSVEEVKATLLDLMGRGMALFDAYGISSDEIVERFDSAHAELGFEGYA